MGSSSGGSLKGNSSSNINRGRGYGMILLLAFGAAIFGVMVLHKLRERRIFNLLVKEKDRELISLQLLLQKERDSSKDQKRKTEEMKAKIYSLRTQKMELNTRLVEMQSTIASLKDEEKVMELALEEKQNEIKVLQEKEIDLGKQNPRATALTEILKQKEVEIEDLKHRIKHPVNVWSVSTDDPSNPQVNLTAGGNIKQKDRTDGGESKELGVGLHESTNYKDGDNSTRGEDEKANESTDHREGENSAGAKDGVGDTNRREMSEEQLQKLNNSRDEHFQDGDTAGERSIDEDQGKENEGSQNGKGFKVGEETYNGYGTEATDGGKGWKSRDQYSNIKAMDDTEHGIPRDGQEAKLNSENGASSRVRGRQGYASKTKRKTWRIIGKNRGLEHNGDSKKMEAGIMRSRRFFKAEEESEGFNAPSKEKLEKSEGHQVRDIFEKFKQSKGRKNDDQDALEGGDKEGTSNDGRMETNGGENGNKNRNGKAVVSSDVKLLKSHNPEDVDNRRIETENPETNHRVEEDPEMVSEHGNLEKIHYTLYRVVSTNRSVNGQANNAVGDAAKQKLDEEVRQSEDPEASVIRQNMKNRDDNEVENNTNQAKVADEDKELEDIHERETAAANGDVFRESSSKREEDNEEYKEGTDESEF